MKRSIVHIFYFPVDISHCLSWKCWKATNHVFTILCHQLHMISTPLDLLVAMFDLDTVRAFRELLSLLPYATCLDGNCILWCKRNAHHQEHFSPVGLNPISTHLIHEIHGGYGRWMPGSFVFINQPNTGHEQSDHMTQVEPRIRWS